VTHKAEQVRSFAKGKYLVCRCGRQVVQVGDEFKHVRRVAWKDET